MMTRLTLFAAVSLLWTACGTEPEDLPGDAPGPAAPGQDTGGGALPDPDRDGGPAEGPCTPGESRPAGDGCNSCTCVEGDQWACTLMGCGPAPPPPANGPCTPGETRPAEDGCNTCTCMRDGSWGCTRMGCTPDDPAPPGCRTGSRRPAEDGCNTCECMEDGTWACTEMACQPVEPPRAGSCAVAADCMRGGCSGQLCVGLDDDGASTCEWRDEYACYAEPFADCGCFNGRCAWAPSEALDACVADANQR